jgi:GTP-binding protein LepA
MSRYQMMLSLRCRRGHRFTLRIHHHHRACRPLSAAASDFISIQTHEHLLESIPLSDVRNFCLIAHIDHGKSSLSSRLLELTGNQGRDAQIIAALGKPLNDNDAASNNDTNHQKSSSSSKEKIELLDTLAVERQRGITVKASAATMLYAHPSAKGPHGVLLLHLYDSPGHADFANEVTRSLSFVQGAILLLDAAQGIQAQTWSVYDKVQAMAPNAPHLMIALTKVDLDAARPVNVALTVSEWLDWDDPDSILLTSARNRFGVKELLDAICEQVPPPTALADDDGSMLRAQVVDSWYDSRGVNCLVQILSGEMKESDRISIVADSPETAATSFSVQEVGIVLPLPHRTSILRRGQWGYVRFGLRDPRQAMPGTLLVWSHQIGKPMLIPPSAKSVSGRSALYASVHPVDADGFEELCNAVDRLALNDTGLSVQMTASVGSGEGGGPFLGPGLRVGFQGLLHVEVFRQRLSDEFGIEAVVTPPKVPYTITFLPGQKNNLKESHTKVVEDLKDWPEPGTKYKVLEPVVNVRIVARVEDAGSVMDLINRKRGTELQTKPIDEDKWLFTARLPWAECVTDFHDLLKNATAGYGSMDTSEADPPLQEGKLSKVDILLNGEVVEPLAFVCHNDNVQAEARSVCKKLQEVLPRHQFVTVIQGVAAGKIVASERIKAYRKDVLTKSGKTVGGGDVTRKMKLLEKQKKGKKRMQESGRVKLSQEAFNSVISRS